MNYVLGTAVNLDPRDLTVFLHSFRRHNEEDEVILFVNRHFPIHDPRVRQVGISPGGIIINERYSFYREFLKNLKPDAETQILISDVRDVVFMGNPFLGAKDQIRMAGENVEFESCPINRDWMMRAYGKFPEWSEVFCAGTTMMPYLEMMWYLGWMVSELDRLKPLSETMISDQAAHNAFVHWANPEEELRSTKFLTVGHLLSKFSPDYLLSAESWMHPALIHQYDRSPVLVEHFRNLYL